MSDKTENIKTRLSFDGEAEYKAACKEINSTLKVLNSEMKLVTAEYKDNANSAEALKAKQSVLQRTYDEQAKKVKETEQALEKCRQATGENSEESKKLEAQLNYQRTALVRTEQELNKTVDELEKAENATDDLGEKVEESGQQAEGASGKFSGLSSILGELGGAMAKGVAVIGTAAAAIGTAVVAGLGYAVSQADEAKGALNDFCAATGTATEDAGQYKQAMESIYNSNFGECFEDIAAAMAEVRQQAGNLGADELEKMTTNALALRDTFDFDIAESTRAATQLMQKFGLSSDEAYNLIAQGAQNGLNKNGDLLDVINEYSNQYSQAGLSAEDMFNSIANGAATGVWSIDKMGDAFKEFNIRMNDGTANEYLTSLGLNSDEVIGKFQKGGDSAKEAMSKVSEALKNCDDKSLQYTAGVGLMGTMWEDMGADACMSLMDVEGQISKTTDAMGKINAVKYDTFGEVMQGIGRILQTSFIMPIGDQALPVFSQFANELAQGAEEAGGDMGKLAQSFGDALGNMVNGLAEMLPQITSFAVELVRGLVDGIAESASAIMQAGVGMITGLVDGIVEAIPTLAKSATEIITTLINGIVGLVPTLAESAVQIIAGLAKGLGEALPELIPSVIDAVLTIVDTLINNVPMLIDAALQLATGLADGIIAALPIIVERLPQIITSIINALAEGIPLIIESADDIIIALIDGIITAIPLLIATMPQITIAIAEGLIKGIPKIVAATGQLVVSIIAKLVELPGQIDGAIADGINKIAVWGASMQKKGREVIKKFVTEIINAVKELPQKINNSIIGSITKISEWGSKMANKAKEKMNEMVMGIVNIVKNIPQKIYNSILGAVSKVSEWGKDVKDEAVKQMKKVVKGIKDSFDGIGKTFTSIGKNIVEGIWDGMSKSTKWIKDKISGWVGDVTKFLKKLFGINSPSTLMRDEVGVYLAQGIGVGFSEEIEKVKKVIENSIPREFDMKVRAAARHETGIAESTEAEQKGKRAMGGITIIQNIYADSMDYAMQQKEAERRFRQAARTVLA